MTHDFGKDYWEQHWQQGAGGGPAAMEKNPPNPYLVRGASGLTPGTALDAGCGAGAEAIWLASQGWQVTAVDISSDALAKAAGRAEATSRVEATGRAEATGRVGLSPRAGRVRWVEADLTGWRPETQYGLVTTHYAHPAMPQVAFYERISEWVAPGGTLLIVGHLDAQSHHGQHPPGGQRGHHDRPAEATVTVAGITAVLDDAVWEIATAAEQIRTLTGPAGRSVELCDVVVQATRRS